jgi:hypothetical protein
MGMEAFGLSWLQHLDFREEECGLGLSLSFCGLVQWCGKEVHSEPMVLVWFWEGWVGLHCFGVFLFFQYPSFLGFGGDG